MRREQNSSSWMKHWIKEEWGTHGRTVKTRRRKGVDHTKKERDGAGYWCLLTNENFEVDNEPNWHPVQRRVMQRRSGEEVETSAAAGAIG
jgi:hypothetical protein